MTVQVWQSNLTGEKIYTVCKVESPYYTYIGTEEWPDPPEPGGGGGGESTIAWRPTVSADGTISWTRTSATNTPTPVNVRGEKGDKGDKGDAGEQGEKGDAGEQGVKGDDGFSPAVTITDITGGHRVNITDKDHPQGQSFDVMDGKDGGGGGGGTVDTAMSDTSKNAVQNKVIKAYVDEGLAGKAAQSSVLALQNSLEGVRSEAEGTQAELTQFKADYVLDMASKQTMAVINWQYEFLYAELLEMLKCGGAVVEWGEQTYMPVVGFEDKVVEDIRTINAFVHNTASTEGISLFWFTWTVAEADKETVNMSPDSSSHEVTAVGVPWVAAQLSYKQDTLVSGTNVKTVNGNSLLGAGNLVVGNNFEVGVEKWQGTYTEDGVTYQVYSKIIKIDALPATAGITNYPHGIQNIKQILSAYGFTTDGFVLNAPRQNAQDNIAIYQVSKNNTTGSIAIEVGKDRSSKQAYVCLVYAKNN